MWSGRIRILLLIALAFVSVLIVGCLNRDSPLHPVTVPDNVASVVISRSGGGTKQVSKIQYTDSEKILRIIEYLTTVELKGKPLEPLEFPIGWSADGITLYDADGNSVSGYSICYFAFRRSEGDWYSIDSPEYEYFCSLIEEIQPDTLTEH